MLFMFTKCKSQYFIILVKENKDAIELVQKAFDEILLPEPEDFFSDDQFKSEGIDSDEAHLQKSEAERERNTSTSTQSPRAQRMGTKPMAQQRQKLGKEHR